MDDGGAAFFGEVLDRLEAHLHAGGPLLEVGRGIAEVKDALAAGGQPFGGAALALAGLDHFQVQVTPAREGVAVCDLLQRSPVAPGVAGVEPLERPQPEQGAVVLHPRLQVTYHHADLVELAFEVHANHSPFKLSESRRAIPSRG
ncbi:hypothetical protein FQZ97_1000440 [compost metagenome]